MDAAILDEEFRKIIVEMKPHARLLPHKSGKLLIFQIVRII